MNPSDRRLVEAIRAKRSASSTTTPYTDAGDLLAVIDRLDPPPPERIVVSEAARQAYYDAGVSAMHLGVNAGMDRGLRAAFKVMLADNCRILRLRPGPYVAASVDGPQVYRALTGEEWPNV